MSWLDKINNQQFEIITGDGSVFYPIWKNTGRSRELNATRFEFSDVEGSLVKRGKVSSLTIPFQFWFQGDDHLEQAIAFEEATKDTRPWTLRHTYYDDILVQPATLDINNDNQNISILTGEFWETIRDSYPDTDLDLKADVEQSVDKMAEDVSENYGESIGTVESSSISTANNIITDVSDRLRNAAVTNEDLEVIENTISEAFSALDNITNNADVFMNKMTSLARTPARLYTDINTRLTLLQDNYNEMKLAVQGTLTLQNKLFFESFGSILVAAMSEASVLITADIADEQGIDGNTIEDYRTRTDVIGVIDSINLYVNDFISTLGGFQTPDGSTLQSYIPNVDTINGINETARKAIARLDEIAVGAKQQRSYTLPEDLPIIPLVHRLYGSFTNNVIKKFIEDNNVILDEMLIMKKDREVVYYI